MDKRVLLLAVLLTGCGPDATEVGWTALLGAGLYACASGLLVSLVSKLWHRIQRQAPSVVSPWMVIALLLPHLAVSLLAEAVGEVMVDPLLGVFVVAASHMALALTLWRIVQRRIILSVALASAISLLPAPALILTTSERLLEGAVFFWLCSGYLGGVPMLLTGLLLLEAFLRRRRRPPSTDGAVADVFD